MDTKPTIQTPFPLQAADVDFLAGTFIPYCLAGMLVYFFWCTLSSTPLVDVDDVVPHPPRFQVDVNHASWQEIAQLPGVGQVLAQRIVDQRKTHGPYQLVEELDQVNGIGEKKLQGIRGYLLPIEKEAELADPTTPCPIPVQAVRATTFPTSIKNE